MAIVPITNLRGPAARISEVTAEVVPADQPADVVMTGLDQDRKFHFKNPRGLPGVNALENDAAVGTYVAAADSVTGKAVRDAAAGVMPETVLTNKVAPIGDVTAAVQAVIDGMSDGEMLTVPAGNWQLDGTLTIPHDDFTLRLIDGATLDRSAANPQTDGILATGARFTLEGGSIVSPEWWDGTNVAWTYAVVRCTGVSPRITGTRILNVPRVGLGFVSSSGTAVVDGVTIEGNYPAAQWNEVETAHFGVTLTAGIAATVRVVNSTIRSCVQGVFIGSGASRGSIIANNEFGGCHNHALYNAGGSNAMIVSDNTIIDCSRPIAMTGVDHIVSDNVMVATGTGGNLHAACSIHMRNASGCIVSGNRLKGDSFQQPAINIGPLSGGTLFRDNIVTNNAIEMTSYSPAAAIQVGASTATVDGVVITGNIITAPGSPSTGLITVIAASGAGTGVKISDNVIRVRGNSNGIHLSGIVGGDVSNNDIRLEWDAASAKVLAGVFLAGSSQVLVAHNAFIVNAAWGSNVTYRSIWESGATALCQYVRNRFRVDATKLAASVHYFIQSTSASLVDAQQAGAPAIPCGPGSIWLRTDGGAGSTVYVKETAASSAVWRAL